MHYISKFIEKLAYKIPLNTFERLSKRAEKEASKKPPTKVDEAAKKIMELRKQNEELDEIIKKYS